MARHRAAQRWSALVGAPTSRVAGLMRPLLGDAHWAAFVAHANEHHKPAFLAAFGGPSGRRETVLRCVGPRDGAPCPAGFEVDLLASEAYDLLERLHLDHEQDVRVTCDLWRRALPAAPAGWDDGVDGGLLCHLLFGVEDSAEHGPRCVRFRCGPPRWGGAERGDGATPYCHELGLPHYTRVRAV